MKRVHISYIIILFFFISGCVNNNQPLIPISTGTSMPPIPLLPSLPAAESTPAINGFIPHGQPVSEWNGVPIMPDAIAGEGDVDAYRFTIKASREEIQGFYERELATLGWEMLGVGEGKAGAVIIFFSRNEESLSISIFPNNDTSIVMLV